MKSLQGSLVKSGLRLASTAKNPTMETLHNTCTSSADLRRPRPRAKAVLRLRALRHADRSALQGFLHRVDEADLRLRFHAAVSRGSEALATELTRHDGHSRLALAVVAARPGRSDELLAVLNVACSGGRAEWAVLVRSDLKGRGLGTFLLDELLRRAARLGIHELHAETLAGNHRLLALARRFGHAVSSSSDGTTALTRVLAAKSAGPEAETCCGSTALAGTTSAASRSLQ